MGSTTRVTYFVNVYPKTSHSFIRREILALERRGFEIQRIASRGWNEELVDPDDVKERSRTHYVLQDGIVPLCWALLRSLVTAPRPFLSALGLALRMARSSERAVAYHLAYLAEACRMLPWIRAFGATHVHAHFGTNSAEIAMLTHALGGPAYSFTVHGAADFDKLKFLGLREKVRQAAFVVAVSSYGRSQLYRCIERTQWPKVNVVHCGLEREFYAGAATPPSQTPRLVCVGRLAEEKGQLLLLQALALLGAKGMLIELVLAGDGPMRRQIEALATELGLNSQLRITGWISSHQVREELLGARGLVLPSFAEGLPVVIMEAMALRRAVLATHVGGIPELVRPGEHGWLVPPGSVDDLAAAMEEFLRTPLERLRQMGDAAYQRVTERHAVDTEATKLARLFHETA
jgi:colanic acid/amylovoran biosynthesis glycosyltransferase